MKDLGVQLIPVDLNPGAKSLREVMLSVGNTLNDVYDLIHYCIKEGIIVTLSMDVFESPL